MTPTKTLPETPLPLYRLLVSLIAELPLVRRALSFEEDEEPMFI